MQCWWWQYGCHAAVTDSNEYLPNRSPKNRAMTLDPPITFPSTSRKGIVPHGESAGGEGKREEGKGWDALQGDTDGAMEDCLNKHDQVLNPHAQKLLHNLGSTPVSQIPTSREYCTPHPCTGGVQMTWYQPLMGILVDVGNAMIMWQISVIWLDCTVQCARRATVWVGCWFWWSSKPD